MIVSIQSRITDDARLLISDHEAFMDATTTMASSILYEAIEEIRSEFNGQIGQVLTIHRIMCRIGELAKHVEKELEDVWSEEGLRVLTPKCEFESPTVFSLVVSSKVSYAMSTRIH